MARSKASQGKKSKNGDDVRGRDGVKLKTFVERVGLGATPNAAARFAQYANPERQAKELMSDPDVAEMIRMLQVANQKMSQLTRGEVMEHLLDAFAIARVQGDAQAMIRAMAEVNRMNGYYAPEKKEILINGRVQRIDNEMRTLTKEELLIELEKEEETDDLVALPSPDGEYRVQ